MQRAQVFIDMGAGDAAGCMLHSICNTVHACTVSAPRLNQDRLDIAESLHRQQATHMAGACRLVQQAQDKLVSRTTSRQMLCVQGGGGVVQL